MNALESASLVMIPSGYEDGTLGSLKPTDGSGDFTFSRGSNLTATRIGEDGYIKKGYENLLLQSNSFSNTATWIGSNTNRTGGQQGYDGSTDAWLYEKLSLYSSIRQNITYNGVGTYSVYAKAGSLDWIRMGTSTGVISTYFDVQNGVVGSSGSAVIEAKIESAGNGWYKCSMAFNGSISRVEIIATEGNSTFNPTSGSIYIQDAMLNQGLVAYPYIETTTAPVAGGILEDTPRLDWSGSCPSLLLEPQRTNLVPHSEYFGGWQLSNSPTITANAATSPEGVNNAYLLTSTEVSSRVQVPVSPTGTNIQSVYIKYAGSDARVRIAGLASAGNRFEVNVTSSGVAFHSAQYGIIDYSIEEAGNDWYRVTSTQSGGNYYQIYIDVTGNNGSIYIWGAQLEQDATYPTSYIPTYGSSATRLKDICEALNTTSLIGQTQGTLFIDYVHRLVDGTYNVFGVDSGNNTSRIWLLNGAFASLRYSINGVSLSSASSSFQYVEGQQYKVAIVYNTTYIKVYINGSLIIDDSGFTAPEIQYSLKDVSFVGTNNSFTFDNPVNQTLVFPTALSDDECIELTTI